MTQVTTNDYIARKQYRHRIRRSKKRHIFIPWELEWPRNKDGSEFTPKPGWVHYETEEGRGYMDNSPIETPYDYGMTDAERRRKYPEWWSKHMMIKAGKRRKALGVAVRKIRRRVRNGPGTALKRDMRGRILPKTESPGEGEKQTKKEV